ncbi:P-loop NTPase fold protein [Nocardia seriolae]|uniref:P-loop NTPase fold protein n=1 Tax=Nocardia seriolae TaxID=37332 RepID=UPI0008FF5DF6|nr:hypothetical protein IMZ23_20565 [Nocardia seriolae]QUN15479.1 hypothetical protein KEC46_24345 [Nocardia seriolae]
MARDAVALATLIASKRLSPPLAVAVYGEWGSGKTFFMQQMENHIDRLSRNDVDGSTFDGPIRHIKFGAWHYSRGNLWASLLEPIASYPSSGTHRVGFEASVRLGYAEHTRCTDDRELSRKDLSAFLYPSADDAGRCQSPRSVEAPLCGLVS